MGWLDALWRQTFRDERVIAARQFLSASLTVGLFASVVLLVLVRDPERSSRVFATLVAITVTTHLAGPILAAFAKQTESPTLFVLGLSLFASTLGMVATSIWLTLHAATLENVRYLPGVALSLFQQASFEIHFFAPAALRTGPVRRTGLAIGIASELLMAFSLLWRLARG